MECSGLVTAPRIVWLVLAVGAALWAVFVGSEPVYEISACEKIQMNLACGEPIASRYGLRFVLVAAVPVAMCALPAIRGFRWASWVVAVSLIVGALIAVVAGIGTILGAYAYYLPIGLAATAASGFQSWYDRRNAAVKSVSAEGDTRGVDEN